MKKVLFMCLMAISTFAFVACDKGEEGGSTPEGYTLTITPTTVAIGGEITLTIKGENVGEYTWQTCYESENGSNCILSTYENGVAKVTISDFYAAGEYNFYAHFDNDGEEVKTNTVKVTVTE